MTVAPVSQAARLLAAEADLTQGTLPAPQAAMRWRDAWVASALLGAEDLPYLGAQRQVDGAWAMPASHPHAWLALGRQLETLGQTQEALKAYEHAQSLRPRDVLAAVWRAHALARLGRFDEADALFVQIGKAFSWPAASVRLGSAAWAQIRAKHEPLVAVQCLGGQPDFHRIGTLVLVSSDTRYWHRYGPGLLRSWAQQQALWTAQTHDESGPIQLHVHLVNADVATQQAVVAQIQNFAGVSVSHEQLGIPVPEPQSPSQMSEARTWYACARLRVLPWFLERVQQGVLITDMDIQIERDPRTLWAQMPSASAAAVRFDPRAKVLWEEWYMTLALFRSDADGRRMAQDAAQYVSAALAQGHAVWGLDQAALWSVFAEHGGPMGVAQTSAVSQQDTSPTSASRVLALSPSWVRWRGGPAHPDAVISTGVASQDAVQQEEQDLTQGRKVCYTRNFEDVILQRVLADVSLGFYVDVGASHPVEDSNTYALYKRGWRGLAVDAIDYSHLWQQHRPEDRFVQAAVGEHDAPRDFYVYDHAQQVSTGLPSVVEHWRQAAHQPSRVDTVPGVTLNRLLQTHAQGAIVHLMSIDIEGMEALALAGLDLQRWRPWVLVVEAVRPGTQESSQQAWEPGLLAQGYRMVYFDGVNRFYLAQEQLHLQPRFESPPNVWDHFVTARELSLLKKIRQLERRLNLPETH